MIRVRVELLSAIHPSRSRELARMDIANDGEYSLTNPRFGRYHGVTYRGKDREALEAERPSKRGEVSHWPREALHVWNLVAAMLRAMGYVSQSGNTKLDGSPPDTLDEVLAALEESEERAAGLHSELEIYKLVFGELPQ